jgi:O-antigen/teichoic acid export membrane protein
MAGKQLVKNSIIGVVQLILTSILTLISVPIFIHKLGMELYGIFAIVSVIGNLNLLTNFGLNGALLVYIAKQGKCRESDHDIVVTQIIIITLTAIFTIISVIFSNFILLDILKVPYQHFAESKNLLILLVFANSILLVGQTYTAIIDANQKIYLTNICQFIYSFSYWGGLIVAVSMGGNLTIIGIIALTSAILWFFIVMFISKQIWGKLDIIGVFLNFKKTAKKQLIYGSKIYLSGLAGLMFEPLSKILLSNFVGLNAVAFFEIGSKIRGQINGLITKALYPLYPYIASTPKSDLLIKRLFDFSKIIQLIVIPISIIVIFLMPFLLKLWLGPQNLQQTSIFVIIMSSSLLLLSPPVFLIYQYLAAKNMAEKNFCVQLTSAIVNVIIFFMFVNKFGIYSILFSNTLGLFSSYIICISYQHIYWGINFRKEIPYYLNISAYGIIITIICAVIRHYIQVSILDLVIYPFTIGTSFIIFIRMQKLINNDKLEFYFDHFPFAKSSLSRLLIS